MEQWKKARTEQAKGSVQPKNYQKKKKKERKLTKRMSANRDTDMKVLLNTRKIRNVFSSNCFEINEMRTF